MKYSEIKQITLLHRRLGKGKVWNDDGTFDGDWWADVPFGDDELNIALTFEGELMPERVAFINYHLDIIAERDAARAALKRIGERAWAYRYTNKPVLIQTLDWINNEAQEILCAGVIPLAPAPQEDANEG